MATQNEPDQNPGKQNAGNDSDDRIEHTIEVEVLRIDHTLLSAGQGAGLRSRDATSWRR